MAADFPQVAIVTNMIAFAVLLQIAVAHRLTGNIGHQIKGFQNAAGIGLATTQVVYFTAAGSGNKCFYKSSHIGAVNIIPYLLAFVTVNMVFPAFPLDTPYIRPT